TDTSQNSSEWKAIDATTGLPITPTFTGSLEGRNYVSTTTNSVKMSYAKTNDLTTVTGGNFATVVTLNANAGISAAALTKLKVLGVFPVTGDATLLQGANMGGADAKGYESLTIRGD